MLSHFAGFPKIFFKFFSLHWTIEFSFSKMFSKVLKAPALYRSVQHSSVRFQTTTVPKKVTETDKKQSQTTQRRRGTDDLYEIINGEYSELTPLFDKFAGKLKKDVDSGYVNKNHMIAIGNILLSKVTNIKKDNDIKVADHILFERVIKSLTNNNVIHGTHLYKYMKALIDDKKYSKALEVYVDHLQFFNDHPESLISVRGKKEFNHKRDIQNAAIVSYILSLKELSSSVDEQFFKSLLQGSKLNMYSIKRFLDYIKLPKEDDEFIMKTLNVIQDKSFDINSELHLNEVNKLSQYNLLIKLESLCDASLAKFVGKESLVKPETLLAYMNAFNQTGHTSKVMDLWAWGQKYGIIDAKPQIEFWNQLLLAQLKSKVKDKETVVKSVWNLMETESKPNAESYSIYIKCLMKFGQFPEIMSLINKIKTQKPELWTNELKCDTVRTLIMSRKFNDAMSLFKVYTAEEGFKANAETYNALFSGLLNGNKLEEASELLDQMSHDDGFEPDIATWSSIMNYLMKLSIKAELTADETMSHLLKIMTTMKESGIEFNKVAIFMVLTNLLKNKETFEIGLTMLMNFENTSIKLNDIGYTGIITGLTQNGAMENALVYYHKAIEAGVLPKATMYNSIFKGYYYHPDIKATRKFYDEEVLKLAKSGKLNMQPNAFTYYFMISQGLRKDDREFIQFVIDEISKRPTIQLGQRLPDILKRCKEDRFVLPDALQQRLTE